MDAPDPPTTPLSRSASGRVVSNRSSSGRPRRRIGPESEQGRTAATTRTAVDPCSLSGVLGDRIMSFYEVDKLKQIIQCYKTGGFPFPTWLATWKGTCPSCWLTFQKLATVTRHETVNGLVVHAACRDGPLPNCITCGEAASPEQTYRKVRSVNAIRCYSCAFDIASRRGR